MSIALQEEVQYLLEATKLGGLFEIELRDPNTPISKVFDVARERAVQSVEELISSDLFTEDGIRRARKQQTNVRIFWEIAKLCHEAMEYGDTAAMELGRIQTEDLEEATGGRQDKYSD